MRPGRQRAEQLLVGLGDRGEVVVGNAHGAVGVAGGVPAIHRRVEAKDLWLDLEKAGERDVDRWAARSAILGCLQVGAGDGADRRLVTEAIGRTGLEGATEVEPVDDHERVLVLLHRLQVGHARARSRASSRFGRGSASAPPGMRGAQYLVFACGCVMTSRRRRDGSAAQAPRNRPENCATRAGGQTGERLEIGAPRNRQLFHGLITTIIRSTAGQRFGISRVKRAARARRVPWPCTLRSQRAPNTRLAPCLAGRTRCETPDG